MGKEGIGFEPMQSDVEQKEVEKKPKEIIIDSEGHVEGVGLDDIDRYLFGQAVDNALGVKGNFTHVVCKALAERLGYDYSETDQQLESSIWSDSTSFTWTDLRKGIPQYEKTPNPETEKVIRFIKKQQKLTLGNSREWEQYKYKFSDKYPNRWDTSKINAEDIEREFGPFYRYSLESTAFSGPDRDLVNMFLKNIRLVSAEEMDSFSEENFRAAQEIAKRLGYKIEMED